MIKDFLSSIHTNILGKSINDKIVIFESDDWGSIRISSKKNQDTLSSFGIDFSEDQYTLYDGLEKNEDIDILAEMLLSNKNAEGISPKLTLNTVTANPDFELIKKMGFSSYAFEPISKTYNEYLHSNEVLSKLSQGTKENIFMPQFHSREHVNVELWLYILKSHDKFFKAAFEYGIFALGKKYTLKYGKHIAATYDIQNREYVFNSIQQGIEIFKQLFGFNSRTYIPNNYVWNPEWNDILKSVEIEHIQGMKYLLLPKSTPYEKRKMLRLYNGKTSEFGQTYAVRNCTFEPLNSNYSLDRALNEVRLSFMLNKPAIISTHRANFTSRISSQTRDKGIREFNKFIREILKKWPNVKFHDSVELLSYF